MVVFQMGGGDDGLIHGGCGRLFMVSGSTEWSSRPDVQIVLSIPPAWIVPLVVGL